MSVHNGYGERDTTSAESLVQRVRLSIDHGRLHGLRAIDIQMVGDTVILSGRVATFHHKQMATAFASRVAGVSEVTNWLTVDDAGTKPRYFGQTVDGSTVVRTTK
jgi:osmotically-inducible protein OsmY